MLIRAVLLKYFWLSRRCLCSLRSSNDTASVCSVIKRMLLYFYKTPSRLQLRRTVPMSRPFPGDVACLEVQGDMKSVETEGKQNCS